MEILPILHALRRNKLGAMLIGLQIALSLAIVCNSLHIIVRHIQQIHRPTGVDESSLFTFANQWVGKPADLEARIREDLAAIRSTPGVLDAMASNSYPLRGGGWSTGINLKADQKSETAPTAEYFVDEHGLATLGVHLVAGRWFSPQEILTFDGYQTRSPSVLVVTQALAHALFPAGNALGQQVYMNPQQPSRIVGIVQRTQTPWAGGTWGEAFLEQSTFEPYLFVNNDYLYYVVRAQPGRLAEAMRGVPARLYTISTQRVIEDVRSFADTRTRAYAVFTSSSVMLATLSALLLTVTLCGITGLTMYWVAQRRRQIGMRRALGARRVDILRYFQAENLLISGTGALLGVALGLGLNLWLSSRLELGLMSPWFILVGAIIVVVLSQAAVFWPARRAASIAPAIATRGL